MTPEELAYIVELEEQIKQQAAVIEQMSKCLKHSTEWRQGNPAFEYAADLQPCPEVLNKVRADAVRKVAEEFGASDRSWLKDYAQRIEKGEA